MAKYVVLINWTDQGAKNVKDSPARLDAARAAAKKMGASITDFYMTMGAFDMLIIVDAPDDETMAKYILATGMGGNVHTTTLKAFGEDTYRKILSSL
jgi:uncharacterized protein with GYD domain